MSASAYREAPLPVDGQPVRSSRRSPLVYVLSGVAIVVDLAAFVALARSLSANWASASPEVVALAFAYGLALVVGLAIVAILARRYRRELAQLGTLVRRSNAAAPVNALGLFEGVIVEGDEGTFLSHVTESPAVYSEVTVEHFVRQGNASTWQAIGTRSTGVEFYLDDDTGAPLLVDPSDVRVAIDATQPAQLATPSMDALYNELGFATEATARAAIERRCFERVLAVGDRVAIIGRVHDRPGEARRLEVEPGGAITSGGASSLAALTESMERTLVMALLPFGVVATAISVIGLLTSIR